MIDISTITASGSLRPLKPAVREAPREDGGGEKPPADGRTLPADDAKTAAAPDRPELERLAESLSSFVRSLNRDLSFSVHKASGRTVVTVLDGETKEVIRQIPSEEFLRISEALAERRGILLDRNA